MLKKESNILPLNMIKKRKQVLQEKSRSHVLSHFDYKLQKPRDR